MSGRNGGGIHKKSSRTIGWKGGNIPTQTEESQGNGLADYDIPKIVSQVHGSGRRARIDFGE